MVIVTSKKDRSGISGYLDELEQKVAIARESVTPKIGIFWLHLKDGKMSIFQSIDEALVFGQDYGEFIVCVKDHYSIWEFFKKNGFAPKNSNYEDLPRGRVAYDKVNRQYVVFTGKWVSSHPDIKRVIKSEFGLKSNTRWEQDFHYHKFKRWGF